MVGVFVSLGAGFGRGLCLGSGFVFPFFGLFEDDICELGCLENMYDLGVNMIMMGSNIGGLVVQRQHDKKCQVSMSHNLLFLKEYEGS